VLNVFHYESLSDVILAGHSYGGMVITGIGDRIPDKVRALVYLDAFLPEHDQSLFDINIPANSQKFVQGAGGVGGLAVPPPPAAYFNVNKDDASRVDALATPFPLGCFTEKLKLTGAHETIGKHIYVHSTVLPRESPFRPFYDRVKDDPAWQAHTLPCGHDAMLDMPDETAAILESAL
jgi:pimeloyl-ACP methyl ester carboxylesterase